MGEAVEARALDVITIGRASVDLYGQQIGSRLEDITSFAKSVRRCPAHISVRTARLGRRPAPLQEPPLQSPYSPRSGRPLPQHTRQQRPG